MTQWIEPVLVVLIAYLLGSIPFGLLLTRAAGLGDVRSIGSGNIGATNVLRTGNKGLAVATLLLDLAKGAAAVLIARAWWPDTPQLALAAAASVFLGHLFPVWLGFRGGKGLATGLGIIAALHWPSALVLGTIWLLMLLATRLSSLSGITAAAATPVTAAIFGRFDLALLFLGLALLVIWKHRGNISRLLDGTEPKVGQRA